MEQRLPKEFILSIGFTVELSVENFLKIWIPGSHTTTGIEILEGGADIDIKKNHGSNLWELELIIPNL